MYVNVNGKIVNLTTEEYETLIENQSIPSKGPASKMDELIASVNSVAAAITEGGGDTPTPTPSVTYTLTKEGSMIKLEGTDNSVSSVSDDNTTYNFSIEDHTITLAGSDNTVQTVEIPKDPSAILSQSWDTENREYGLTVTDKDTESMVQIQYHLVKDVEANQVVLKAGDREVDRIQLAQDQDTKYRLEKVDNELRLIPSDGSEAIVVTLDDDLNTLYTISFDSETDELKLQANDNSLPQIVSLSKFADAEAVEEALASCADKEETEEALAGKADKSDIPSIEGLAEKSYVDEELAKKANVEDIPDVSGKADKSYVDEELAKKANTEDIPDISNLVTTEDMNTALESKADKITLNEYATTEAVNTALASKADKTALDSYATTEAMNTALETKADKSEIPDISNLVTTEAMNTALETKADKSSLNEYATTEAMNTALSGKADKSEIPDVSGFAEKTYVDEELAKKADETKLLNNDYLYNKMNIANGGYSLIFNESDGGGAQIYNKAVNVISYVGVSDGGPTGIAAQIYSKYISDAEGQVRNEGSRLNINPNGMYYTTKKTDGKFTAEDELATKKDIPDMNGYATTEDVTEATEVVSDDADARIEALRSQIDILNKALKAIKTPDAEDVAIDTNVNEPEKDIIVDGEEVNGVIRVITAKSIDMSDTALESARLNMTASNDVSITGLHSSGNLAKSVSNAAISINNDGDITIKDCTIGQTGYNTIEIGLSADTAPKNVVIDNVYFEGKLANNAISIFRHQKNAEIVISNCVFVDCSNPIRLSNATNQPCKVKLINCEFRKWEEGQYAGALLLQDYTSSSAEEAVTENRFHNIIVEFINCTKPNGEKITGTGEALCTPEQIVYMYVDKSGLVAYDADRFPEMTAY